jgi:UDP-glucose 4-epimerase
VRLLVTGGAGFIGSNLVRRALADPEIDSVAVIDDLSTGVRSALDGVDVEFVEGSILDRGALDRAVAGADAIVHLGALGSVPRSVQDPLGSHHANATGTLEVLEAARRHDAGHVIVASSSSVYGANPALPKHEREWTRPLSPYATSKLATEAYTLAYGTTYGLSTLAFRFFNVYGPRQRHDHAYAAVVPRFLHAALTGEPLQVFGDGRQSRDFTYVGTVCEVLMDAVRRQVSHHDPVNLAFGEPVELLKVIAQLEEILGFELPVEFREPRVGDVRHSQADSTVLHELFPGVTAVPFTEGLQATAAWFRENVALPAR